MTASQIQIRDRRGAFASFNDKFWDVLWCSVRWLVSRTLWLTWVVFKFVVFGSILFFLWMMVYVIGGFITALKTPFTEQTFREMADNFTYTPPLVNVRIVHGPFDY